MTSKQDRAEGMLYLRLREGWSLERIGEKYGVSRERVRQIIGNTGHVAHTRRIATVRKADPRIPNEVLAEMLGYESVRHVASLRETDYLIESEALIAKELPYQVMVADKLHKIGYRVEHRREGHARYLLINKAVIVKVVAAAPALLPSQVGSSLNPRYSFFLPQSPARERVDLYVGVMLDSGESFVIPAPELGSKAMLAITWPTDRPEIGRYQGYYERWEEVRKVIDRMQAECLDANG